MTISSDYIIVGAGSAGCVIARRLIDETEGTVLLIEAGDTGDGIGSLIDPTRWAENMGASHDWGYHYEPTEHVAGRAIPISRGKIVGGSGQTNALVWARGNKADFDGWAAAGNRGWDYDSLLPYFRKSEHWEDGANEYRGGRGPIRVGRAKNLHPVGTAMIEAGQSYGMPYLSDINIPDPEGVGPLNMNIADGGMRSSPFSGYLKPILEHPRLTLLVNAAVTRIKITGSRCTGVHVQSLIDRHFIQANAEVVLCAGAIDSPRLLMLSGIGPADDLAKLGLDVVHHLPGVGQNLQEHIILHGLCFAASVPMQPVCDNLVGSMLFWKSRSDLQTPDLMFVSMQIPYVTREIAAKYPIPGNGFCIAPGLVRIESRGHIRLKTAERGGTLEIQPNMLAEPKDLEALISAVDIGLDLADQPGFRKITSAWAAPAERMSRAEKIDFIRRSASAYCHPVGTCAMGEGDQFVVDRDLRLHGITGLTIADASIMPTITSANTNAPTVAIAEVAAAKIAARAGFPY
jgi:choline dehydrogenase